jgi:hypothetical protein
MSQLWTIRMSVFRASGGGRQRRRDLPLFFASEESAEKSARALEAVYTAGVDPQSPKYSTYCRFEVIRDLSRRKTAK